MLPVCHLFGFVKRSVAAKDHAQCMLLLALIIAGGPLSTQGTYGSHFSDDDCIIPCYISLTGSAGPSAGVQVW